MKMKRLERCITRNWLWLTAGFILTRKAVDYCYQQRGGFQIGGEWLITPAILMAAYLIPQTWRGITAAFREEVGEDA